MKPERWPQVEKIFQSALDRAPAERTAFLHEACAGDESLLREVESLIVADHEAGAFIDPSGASTEWLVDEQEEAPTGKRIGPYQIIREIGRGGMGAVYLAARADDQYHKRVAIKLIRRGMDTHDIIRRFRNERQILAALDHTNIARLLDGGTTDDDLPYVVMEYIEGKPLIDYCDAHKLNTGERLKLFRNVCSAVQYAHQNLIVHRGIKPSNILVTEDGSAKLLDFGIAKLLNPELGFQTIDQTASGIRLMTPDYASPEQVRGDKITTASDVYSLGVVLYELLTGHRPYRLKSRLPHEILRVICEEEPEKPSTAVTREEEVTTSDGAARITLTPESVSKTREGQPEKLRRRLAGDLDNITLKALRKESERRYSSVEQFSDDIRRHLVGRPVIARKGTLRYRSGKFIKRHKAGAIAAGLIVLTLLAGLVATLWQARVASNQRARAERRFNDVRKLANSFMFDMHDQIKDLPGSTKARESLVKKALEYLDSLAQEGGDDPSLQLELATAYQKVGDLQGDISYANLGDTAGAMESHRKALAISEAVLAADPTNVQARRSVASGCLWLSNVLKASGDSPGAIESYRRALTIREALSSADTADAQARRDLAANYIDIGNALRDVGDNTGALESYRKALEIDQALATADPKNVAAATGMAASYINAAIALTNIADRAGALENQRKALAILEAQVAADPGNVRFRRNLAVTYLNTGVVLKDIGDYAGALESLRKALTIFEALAAADPRNVQPRRALATIHRVVSDALTKTADFVGALENSQNALAIVETLSAADPANAEVRRDLAASYNRVGIGFEKTGNMADALENYRKALAIYEALVKADPTNAIFSSELAESYSYLGELYTTQSSDAKFTLDKQVERWREARSWYQRSLIIWLDMRSRGSLAGDEANKPDEINKEIATCDAALAKLQRSLTGPRTK